MKTRPFLDYTSICASEAAWLVSGDPDDQATWRPLLEPARRLAHWGEIAVTQRGRVVDPGTFRGSVRLRRTP